MEDMDRLGIAQYGKPRRPVVRHLSAGCSVIKLLHSAPDGHRRPLLLLAFACKLVLSLRGRCWVRTSDLCPVKAAKLFLTRPNV